MGQTETEKANERETEAYTLYRQRQRRRQRDDLAEIWTQAATHPIIKLKTLRVHSS